ncbi:hypothetical protein ABT133_29100 [Streptomyces sp. NPDC001835]|uniref:hypothetical protein n=1 Tax=Streptomyces sp. NPDC001835 TaxID=3154528 RepID=UPI00332E3E0A
MMNKVTYPLIYTDEEGVAHIARTAEELALIAEFVDDWDPPYTCVDATGQRIRLIVWALQVVLEQPVPARFDPQKLRVEEVEAGEEVISVEFYEESALRALSVRGDAAQIITDLESMTSAGKAELQDVQEFHNAWMRARLGKAYK